MATELGSTSPTRAGSTSPKLSLRQNNDKNKTDTVANQVLETLQQPPNTKSVPMNYIAPPNFTKLCAEAIDEGDLPKAYGLARCISDSKTRLESTRALTQMWLDRGELETLAEHLTSHFIHSSKAPEPYASLFDTCNDSEQLDATIIRILDIFLKRKKAGYKNCSVRECDDYAAFAKACIDAGQLQRIALDEQFPLSADYNSLDENGVSLSSLCFYFFITHEPEELAPNALTRITDPELVNLIQTEMKNGLQFRITHGNILASLEITEADIQTVHQKFGNSFFNPEVLLALGKKNPALTLSALELMNNSHTSN